MDPTAIGPLEVGTAGIVAALAWRLLGILEEVVRERLKPSAPTDGMGRGNARVAGCETAADCARSLADIHKVTTARDGQDRYRLWAADRLADAVEANTRSQEAGTRALEATTVALTSQTTSMADLVVELRRNLGGARG